jgi:hypothetical protein
MKIRVFLAAVTAALLIPAGTITAHAMGSGNPYLDMQVGVTYTVYHPTYTAGLAQGRVGPSIACPKGVEQNLFAQYGKRGQRNFSIWEAGQMCADLGNGPVVLRTTINGAPAVVVAYCDPASSKPCKQSDVIKYGGNLSVTLPGVNGLRPTRIWIETYGGKNLSAQQLVQIARGLEPIATN